MPSLLWPPPAGSPAGATAAQGIGGESQSEPRFQHRGPREACEAAPEAHFKSFLLLYLLKRLSFKEPEVKNENLIWPRSKLTPDLNYQTELIKPAVSKTVSSLLKNGET